MFLIGLLRVVCSNGDIDLDWITSDTVTFFSYDIGINTIELININLNDNDKCDDLETMIHVTLVAWCNEYKKRKAFWKYWAKN